MARTCEAAKFIAQLFDKNESSELFRIDLINARREEIVYAARGHQFGVSCKVARVGVEILAATKLDRIDEDRDDNYIAHGAGPTYQAQMAFVQGAHCRDKSYLAPVPA